MNVQLVAKTVGVGKYEELNSEEIVSAIARHGIIKEDQGKLIKYLMDHKHISPLDMINFVFEIETSLSIGRQLLRHASIKPQEHSLRYAKAVGFEPIELRQEDKKNRQSSTEVFNPVIDRLKESWGREVYASDLVDDILIQIQNYYTLLLEAGVAKECARFILPNCTTTVMSFNGTLRSWLSLLNVRLNDHAQKECRLIAEEILKELKKELPNVFANIDTDNGLFM